MTQAQILHCKNNTKLALHCQNDTKTEITLLNLIQNPTYSSSVNLYTKHSITHSHLKPSQNVTPTCDIVKNVTPICDIVKIVPPTCDIVKNVPPTCDLVKNLTPTCQDCDSCTCDIVKNVPPKYYCTVYLLSTYIILYSICTYFRRPNTELLTVVTALL